MTREVMARHSIDPARVYVAGLSAGGAMAAILGETYPDLYAAVGVHSGLAAGAANDLPSALGAMQRGAAVASANASGIPTIVFHGDADATVHPGNGGHVIAASVEPGASVQSEQGVADGGHRYTRHLHRTSEDGPVLAEHWVVHGAAHAWSGGNASGLVHRPARPGRHRRDAALLHGAGPATGAPLMPFPALGLSPELARAAAQLGFAAPTPIQQEAIPAVLRGADVLGSAPTGSGKTAAFALPLLQQLQPAACTRRAASARWCWCPRASWRRRSAR